MGDLDSIPDVKCVEKKYDQALNVSYYIGNTISIFTAILFLFLNFKFIPIETALPLAFFIIFLSYYSCLHLRGWIFTSLPSYRLSQRISEERREKIWEIRDTIQKIEELR